MNKRILVMVLAALAIISTGCGNVLDRTPKDTVMVKKITKETGSNDVEYEGVLSQEAVKTLSLNAVNKYLEKSLTIDELQFELMAIDQHKFRELLNEAEYGVDPRPERAQVIEQGAKAKLDYQTELDDISGGLYYITLTRLSDPSEVYDIVLNAKDGDVIKLSEVGVVRAPSSSSQSEREKIIALANAFIDIEGSYPLSELSLNEDITIWDSVVELYYTSKEDKKLKYCVTVNVRQNKVVGFSKDVMALLSYYSRL